MSEKEIINKRRNQGFNVTSYMEEGSIIIKAEMKSFISTFTITNRIGIGFFGKHEECYYDVYEMLQYKDIENFLKHNFKTVPDYVRFTWPDGIERNYSFFSVYLPDGNVLAWKSSVRSTWFSLHVISKDRIIKQST